MSMPQVRGSHRPRYDIGDIARHHGHRLAPKAVARPEQRQALAAMAACRTATLGGHLDVCSSCGDARPAYNSCRNRHCPKCQALAQERWIEGRQQRVLPTRHFHVVFTVPRELHALVAYRRRELLSALMRTAADTLLELGRCRMNATLGVTAVLHTWTRDLRFHPHVHCVVTAGGLSLQSRGGWSASRRDYLFPVRVLGSLFRGKLLAEVRRLYRARRLEGFDDFADPQGYGHLMQKLSAKAWNVYCKVPFGNADHVFRYLGRYTHRVGIANSRIVYADDDAVTFRTKQGRTATLHPVAFLERLLQHVLPHQFVKIRHYGLYATAHVHDGLQRARAELAADDDLEPNASPPALWYEFLLALTQRDVRVCDICGGEILPHPMPAFPRCARSPPS